MRLWNRGTAAERERRRKLRKAHRKKMRELRRTHPEQWREYP
jgi:hypothetical protein